MNLLKQLINSWSGASSQKPLLIAFGWESNSGGQAKNQNPNPGTPDPTNYPTSQELSATPNVRILNPLTLEFENLHIGVNENLDHFNLPPHTTHGWHLQLKNRQDAGTFRDRPIYICELGQGGSYSDQWLPGTPYDLKEQARLSAAVAGILDETGEEPDVVMFNSFGINDSIGNINANTFVSRYFAMMDRAEDYLGIEISAFMVDLPFTTIPDQAAYRTAISGMATTRPGKIFIQDMQGKQQDDQYHLGYKGFKVMTDEKIAKVLEILG